MEFLMALEKAFDLRIPDEIAISMRTPQKVIEYIYSQMPHGESGVCLPQRAFYRLRDVLAGWFCLDRSEIRPSTRLDEIIPPQDREAIWAKVGEVFDIARWPRIGWSLLKPRVKTVAEAAIYLATTKPTAIKLADEFWTEHEVAWVVDQLIRKQLGVAEYELDHDFVKDLGVD
ncbi:MAG: hypothetical protein HY815_02095 [Candidatus Riflebacteria bacterium]|nr:hypothetical protein [Candidatus Riflebacteria bacterium]